MQQSQAARERGALVPLVTKVLPPGNWAPFQLRQLQTPVPRHLRSGGPRPNPFLPWEQQLEVERLASSHAVILNKYPVQAGHLLLITQDWAPQSGWLGASDWQAVAHVDADTTGLWFFNSSGRAGASQPHRHLQLLPRHRGEPNCPLEPALRAQLQAEEPSWPWRYRLSRRPAGVESADLAALYRRHALELGLGDPAAGGEPSQPYNLLFTASWFLTILRSREHAAGFSLNALGFAGYLLLTERSDLAWLNRHGPWELLSAVAPAVTPAAYPAAYPAVDPAVEPGVEPGVESAADPPEGHMSKALGQGDQGPATPSSGGLGG
ncbi:ATP adenylyltransferase [Synechococcus sp. ATX 2A4]|uniref:ATP adenylyltransferase n=1 Tax=Synechococcus sp. ATX 2A4 TaxID=2823727 RepID=UPI0028F46079|nr:ATP adenylyltransferase [Synechococcus sp. ATX 2A4]